MREALCAFGVGLFWRVGDTSTGDLYFVSALIKYPNLNLLHLCRASLTGVQVNLEGPVACHGSYIHVRG